ncbi:MAG: terpene cyclase/mutase family protein [Planctomycetes bacterium]|nr:terpene cyclase/mutase family protein [Planctomycetota bacterium]
MHEQRNTLASIGHVLVAVSAQAAVAEEPVTLQNVKEPSANTADEPVVKQFSLDAAVQFLDSAALSWQQQRKCFTCHTNYAYLYARPAISPDAPAHAEVRKFAEELVSERWKTSGPRWDAEVVATAAALAFNDAATTGKLHPLTQTALDRMWTVQREDGGWNWLKCNWPPMESDDHYGATLAALAVGVAPGGYAKTELAQNGLDKIRKYLKDNPAPTLHHEAMILWVATYLDGFMSDAEKKTTIDKLLALQKPDGGWGLATLGNWKRSDDMQQDTESSDGYGTGFVIYVLRRAGVPASDKRLQGGVAWLKSHQRESGRWFTRSLNKDSKHFITHAGTAFAVMALAACDATQTASAKN